MVLFSWTLLEGQGSACDWFLIHKDKSIKTIRDFLHDFLERFGDDQDEIYSELIDDFMGKWKGKNLSNIETISSGIEVDAPSDPIKEINEIVQNMQPSQEEPCEAMNEQFVAIEDQLDVIDDGFTKLISNIQTPMNLSLTVKKIRKFIGKLQMNTWMSQSFTLRR